jgi:hypothetical protein
MLLYINSATTSYLSREIFRFVQFAQSWSPLLSFPSFTQSHQFLSPQRWRESAT